MIIHTVKIGESNPVQIMEREHKRIYVAAAMADVWYRDLLVHCRHRWEFFTRPTIDFLTFDWEGGTPESRKLAAEKRIKGADGVMVIVTRNTHSDANVLWEMDLALAIGLPMAGIDVGRNPEGIIPDQLTGKITRYGWEWFAEFIDGL
ncbi:MAG: hypothetical protein MI747_24315 [Desulfobacterales bacterium]|nr:hypothetical protein [Desulfobacterales bacterium]